MPSECEMDLGGPPSRGRWSSPCGRSAASA